MWKRGLIVGGFTAVCAAALWALYAMKGAEAPVLEPAAQKVTVEQSVSDSVHSYNLAELADGCSADDGVFCAIELAVKCTMNPDMAGCDKGTVPGFVLGKTEETPRPTEIAFTITKIKPVPGNSKISVYTTSDCDAVWFGLCKGTVIYSLKQEGGRWVVDNIFALEP